MYDLSEGAVIIVADGIRQTLDSLDTGLEASLRTFADAIDGLRGSDVPGGKTQKIYDALVAAITQQRDARKSVLEAVRHLTDIQHQSTQRELDVGCAAPWAKLNNKQSVGTSKNRGDCITTPGSAQGSLSLGTDEACGD